ncbi:MAG TPA: sulfite exporter TauE/SafE family protein [Blastocatellia bacterium]|nr:sulfite exporter TauE/SafE family protein [Blastocatellia bacterium]
MPSLWQGLVISAAAFGGGMMNSVAGGGTLLTFPALIWMGIDPKVANVTSTVALWPGSLGAMFGFRRELAGSRRWMIVLGPASVLGGLVGAILLLQTPSRTFAAIVPYLILFATLLFAAGEPLTRMLRRKRIESSQHGPIQSGDAEQIAAPDSTSWAGAATLQFFSSVYGGYFGAGNGIIMLAGMTLFGLTDIHQMNGLKNFFAVCINVIASAYFILSGALNDSWAIALVMTVSAIAGGYVGAGLARRSGRRAVRRAVVVIGIAMALSLFLRG